MTRKQARYVWVDQGYGMNECWYTARVVDSRMVKDLFGSGQSENLLVELPGGERTWVSYWKDELE